MSDGYFKSLYMDNKTRQYPIYCQSAYCGKSGPDCNSKCQNWPILQDFKKWVKDNDAVCVDPVWNPNLYRSNKDA